MQEEEDEDGEDGHRVCTQYQATPSPVPPDVETTPPPLLGLSGAASEPAGFLCLFPESTPTTPPEDSATPPETSATPPDASTTPSSAQEHSSQSSYEEELVSTSYLEEVDNSLMEHHLPHSNQGSHTDQDNDFAELDPFLSPTHTGVQHPANFDHSRSAGEWEEHLAGETEVGYDVARDTANLDPTAIGDEGVESSPPDSVLYS